MSKTGDASVIQPKPTMHSARLELFEATPMEVWKEYANNGYTWVEMVNEEMSYAEPLGKF